MAHDRSPPRPRPSRSGWLGAPVHRLFNAGLHALSVAEQQALRAAPGASALGAVLRAAARQRTRNPLATATAAANAVAAGASMVLERLGTLVEPRMSRALNALQIPTAADLQGLARRVEELNASVQHLAASRPPAAKARAPRRAAAGKRAAQRTKSPDRS